MMQVLLLVTFLLTACQAVSAIRTWECHFGKCTKAFTEDDENAISLGECKVTCLPNGGLWPKPTQDTLIGSRLVTIDSTNITFQNNLMPSKAKSVLTDMEKNFLNNIEELRKPTGPKKRVLLEDPVYKLNIITSIADPDLIEFVEFANETYSILATPSVGENILDITINANTILGANHAMTSLSQLIAFDDLRGRYRMVQNIILYDSPVFTHRGISLDTARSYMPPETIKNIIRTMSQSKLNTLHWHMTDSQSFPFVSTAYPELSETGAYSETAVYTPEMIKGLISFARGFGIRIVPEIDAPAHVGEGWSALGQDLITCFKWEPWTEFCAGPPCGQLDPTQDALYEILGGLFHEFEEVFTSDLFHMGGDEVNVNCWRSTPRITEWMAANNISITDEGFLKLWGLYQKKSFAQLKAVKPEGKFIVWFSSLTQEPYINTYLNSNDYIVQVWTLKDNPNIAGLIKLNYSLIFSNHDELFFDCGGPAWIGGPGQNWCAPYIGWQSVYRHSPYQIVEALGVTLTDDIKKLILGSEAAMWTDQYDQHTVHARLWPRAAALAERLWSNPSGDWTDAQYRMNHHRERVLRSELLQPAWCYQNDGYCGTGHS